jgi:NitT/TauT family transport system ATP-binding protein
MNRTEAASPASTPTPAPASAVPARGGPDDEPGRPIPDASVTLDVRGLGKIYSGHGRQVEAIRDLTFTVNRGEFVCVVGPSGAGKTTLLRSIAGLLEPTRGEILLEGAPVTAPPRDMAVVFQEYGRSLFPWMTVRRNVERPLIEKGMGREERRAVVDEALAAVDLGDSGDAHPWQLSGGMQQRVAIARAVAYRPSILLMDEPFAAVDAQTRAELEDLVRTLWNRLGVTVLFITHDIDEAVYLGERVLVLSNRPTVVLSDVRIDLPAERDQLQTRSAERFGELRGHVYELVQQAKKGQRP